jgi:predicted small secreted protein
MKLKTVFAPAALLLVAAFALAGCQEKEGPAERVGKQIDKAAASVGDSIERAGQKLKGE